MERSHSDPSNERPIGRHSASLEDMLVKHLSIKALLPTAIVGKILQSAVSVCSLPLQLLNQLSSDAVFAHVVLVMTTT